MTKKLAVAGIALALCAMAFLPTGLPRASAGDKPGEGEAAAPDFSLSDLDGRAVSLKDILSKPNCVVLSFWGVRCSACLEEMKALNVLAKKWGPKGVAFLGVNVDAAEGAILKDLLPKVGAAAEYPLLSDPDMKVVDLYKMQAAPLTVVITPAGKVVYRHEGYVPGDENRLDDVLGGAVAAMK